MLHETYFALSVFLLIVQIVQSSLRKHVDWEPWLSDGKCRTCWFHHTPWYSRAREHIRKTV